MLARKYDGARRKAMGSVFAYLIATVSASSGALLFSIEARLRWHDALGAFGGRSYCPDVGPLPGR